VTTSKSPSVLYHYTTSSGLLGILNTKRIWATHARFLNDAQELDYGLTLIREILHSYPAGDLVSAAATHLTESRPAYFLTCFCAVDDLLSQWRAYARSPNGTGYSLGFETRFLPAEHLVEVEYDPATQAVAVRSAIDEHLARVGKYSEDYLRFSLQAALLRLAIRLKHPTFREEREWRLVYYLEDEYSGFDYTSWRAEFRASDRFIVPYIQVELPTRDSLSGKDPLHLKSIRVGPSANPEEARYALKWMIWSYDYPENEPTLYASETPLRL
jgi:hypothetical protein